MKILKIVLIVFLILSIPSIIIADDFIEPDTEEISTSSVATSEEPEIYSRRAIVLERNSKAVLYEKNSNEQCKMASTTKVMTCILILENCDLSATATISPVSAATPGSRLGLHTNDSILVEHLLYGLMLCSGNDAAVALAEFCSGSVEEFAVLMNQKAKELGLVSTSFATPHGLDNDNHFTTASDFARLTDYALNNPLFVQIVGTQFFTVSINGIPKSIHNTNALLGSIPGVYGVKTGFTSQAGRCLISATKRDNLDIIVIVFGADTTKIRTADSIALINYIFANYEAIDLSSLVNEKYSEFTGCILPYIEVTKSSDTLVPKLENINSTFYPVKKDLLNSVSVSTVQESLEAPVSENQKIAEINIYINNNRIFSTNIVSSTYISRKSWFDYVSFFVMNYKNFYQIY